MSLQIICDGCGNALDINADQVAISGKRANNLLGGSLPNGRFDWCLRCAQIAFKAVKEDVQARMTRENNER